VILSPKNGGVGSLLTFDIPQTALVATLDTYDFYFQLISYFFVSRLGQGWDDSIHKDPLKEISDLLDKNEDFKTQQQTPEAPEKSSENSTENSTENSSNNSTEKSSENSTENCEETKPDIEDKQKQNKAETSNKITQPSNEELAKMWQSRTRQSIAQKLKRK
jgi:hypothetical protein